MPPPYITTGLNVPSLYLDYQKGGRSQLQAKAGFFKVGLNKARSILNPSPSVPQKQTTHLPPVSGSEPRSKSAERPAIMQKTVPPPLPNTFVIEDTKRGMKIDSLIEQRTQERQIRMKATLKSNYSLQRDKEFLELIHSTTRSRSYADLRVRDITQKALSYLDTRTQYWNQQIPEHVRKTTQTFLPDEDEMTRQPPQAAMQTVLKKLHKINKMMHQGDYNYVIFAATKLMNDVKRMEKRLPGKESILATCCSILGNAYLEIRDEKNAVSFHTQDFRLGSEFNIAIAKSRALDNLGRVYARIGKFKRAIQVWCKRLSSPSAIPADEKAWLCHELGYCYLKTKEHNKARQCGELSYKAATEMPDEQWQLNANMLIVQAILLSGNPYGCQEILERALAVSSNAGENDPEFPKAEAVKDVRKVINYYKSKEKEAKALQCRSAFSLPKSAYSMRSRGRTKSKYMSRSRETLPSAKSSKTLPLPGRTQSPIDFADPVAQTAVMNEKTGAEYNGESAS